MASFDNKIDFHFQFLYIHYLRTSHPIPNMEFLIRKTTADIEEETRSTIKEAADKEAGQLPKPTKFKNTRLTLLKQMSDRNKLISDYNMEEYRKYYEKSLSSS